MGMDKLRRVRLDRFGDVELARDSAAFAHEEVFADQRLPGRERIAAGAPDDLRDFAHFAEIERRIDPVKTLERERDLAEIGVAGAFAHPIDGPLNPRSSGTNRGDSTSRSHTEIIMPMKMDWYA